MESRTTAGTSGSRSGDRLNALDPASGKVMRSLDVAGHAGTAFEIRRVDPRSGEVQERLEMPRGVGVSGLEADGGDLFYCGGGGSGRLRAVRRPRRRSATGRG
jgi:hypothetical protein